LFRNEHNALNEKRQAFAPTAPHVASRRRQNILQNILIVDALLSMPWRTPADRRLLGFDGNRRSIARPIGTDAPRLRNLDQSPQAMRRQAAE